MTSEEEIFFGALARPTLEARAAYLAEACALDADKLRRVTRLLKAHARLGDFLERPPAWPDTAAPLKPQRCLCPDVTG
jgi:hypothetical protein